MFRTTAAVVVTAAAATTLAAHATADPAPVRVTLGDARCEDMSTAVAMIPELQVAYPDPAHTPIVEYRIEAAPGAQSTPYELKINGETKGQGEVGSSGLVNASTPIPNGQEVTAQVTSGDKILATRDYRLTC